MGTEFQKSVWNALRKISPGKTKSYGEIAKAIGKPKAVRAVGGACGANPVPVLVPCHRVLAANKKLGGFSGGLDWKRKLLAREDVCWQKCYRICIKGNLRLIKTGMVICQSCRNSFEENEGL